MLLWLCRMPAGVCVPKVLGFQPLAGWLAGDDGLADAHDISLA
jgi:hypothetical protein